MEQVEIAFKCINELDWQVTKSKHVISKYKDLVVKMQLQLNSKNHKIDELRQEKKKYKD
jgi:predicted  nucleic acid-binding Zn-ribbon protein